MFRRVFWVFWLVIVGLAGCNKQVEQEVPAPMPVFAERENPSPPTMVAPSVLPARNSAVHYADEPQAVEHGPNGVPQAPSMVPEAK